MSVKMMSIIWEMDLPPTDKLVLLAVADWARDDGSYCWPSISTIAKKSGVSERTVQRTLRAAEQAGHLTRIEDRGKGCRYLLHPRHSVTPDTVSPVTNETPTPDTVSPNTLGTVIGERELRARAILASPQWKAFKAMRRQIKKPVNETAEKRLLAKLLTLDDAGYPPGEVLDQSTEHCWQGVFKIEEQDDGQANRRSFRSVGGPRPDPTLALVRSAINSQREDDGSGWQAGPSLPARFVG